MSAARYRKFFRLCEEWPVDSSKQGRDLAVIIRRKVAEAFKMGENTQIADPAKCDSSYESLQKLNTDFYRNKYSSMSAERSVGASGLTYEQCRAVMASESLEELKNEELGFLAKLKRTFTADRGEAK
ncbi:hypothetical protein BaRGS_00007588 [Batillaria attramentaria]|uniref:Mitochondrial nucleoid factor 1 n=1 Tax=Batillaria attramentaria TaxID=370345 RepID=A0ABD0LPF7_9CAEN